MNFRWAQISLLVVLVVALGACGYDSHTDCDVVFPEVVPNAFVADLQEYADSGVRIEQEAVMVGRVVANDASGNFYRSIVVVDASGGVEVKIGGWELSGLYPLGSEVAIYAEGLMVTREDGVLTLGREVYDWSDGRVEPIEPRDEFRRRVVVTDYVATVEPRVRCIEELTEDDCGALVRVEGLTYVGEPMGWGTTEYGSQADREFVDSQGHIILVRTSRYADFAKHQVPTQQVAVRGILYRDRHKGKDVYVLKVRDLGDVEVGD
ncbi:MAG: hypothetical protein J6U53_04465 [Tidjanibacter sp.]|nr:hypothetical protein [Tidjanibacter sp.]